MVSVAYRLLVLPDENFVPPFLLRWEQAIETLFSPTQWEDLLYFTQYSSIANRYQELDYKILVRWYRVTSVLHKIYPQTTVRCWRFQMAEGTVLHVFWTCDKLQHFWSTVRTLIKQLMVFDPGIHLATYLLHASHLPRKHYKNVVLVHLVNASKACIPAL